MIDGVVTWNCGVRVEETRSVEIAARTLPHLLAHQIRQITATAQEPFKSIMVFAIACANWRVTPTPGRCLAQVTRADSAWTLERPRHASSFLTYRPDREGD